MKGNEKTRNVPIIFISAFDHPEDVVKGLGLGGADYITKPFVPKIVQARVGVHLSLYQANLALKETNRERAVKADGAGEKRCAVCACGYCGAEFLLSAGAY